MASALLHANEVVQALKWATSASLVGAPSAENILFANFEEPRQFRSWDLQVCVCKTGWCSVDERDAPPRSKCRC